MEKQIVNVVKQKNRYFLCIDCYNCKIKNKKVYCKEGYFNGVDIRKASLYTPFDFDCYKLESE